jgi:hypothetical protein
MIVKLVGKANLITNKIIIAQEKLKKQHLVYKNKIINSIGPLI